MIQSREGLDLTIEQLSRMYQILAGLHARVAPLNFQNYLILAEGPVDEIRKLQKEIEDYLAVAQVPREEADEEVHAASRPIAPTASLDLPAVSSPAGGAPRAAG